MTTPAEDPDETKTRASARPGAALIAGRYRLGRKLAEGGFGVVHEGHYQIFGEARRVAIKLLNAAAKSDQGSILRFREEVRILTLLNHRHVCKVIDGGVDGDRLFLVMEYAEGGSLLNKLAASTTGRLASVDAVRWLREAAEGLLAAEQNRRADGAPAPVYHRDIKPANLLLQDDRVLVADFGAAKLGGINPAITRPEVPALWTPAYASPEQALGHSDHRSDVYALGATFFHLLTGQKTLERFKDPEQRYSEAHDPHLVCAEVPAGLGAIVRKMTEPDPKRRHQSFAEVLAELAELAQPKPRPKWWPRRTSVAALAVIGIGALSYLALFYRGDDAEPSSGESVGPNGGNPGVEDTASEGSKAGEGWLRFTERVLASKSRRDFQQYTTEFGDLLADGLAALESLEVGALVDACAALRRLAWAGSERAGQVLASVDRQRFAAPDLAGALIGGDLSKTRLALAAVGPTLGASLAGEPWLIEAIATRAAPEARTAASLTIVEEILWAEGLKSAVTPMRTALQCAALRGDAEVVQLLLTNGADPMATSLDGRTALHLAAETGSAATCAALLDPAAVSSPTIPGKLLAIVDSYGQRPLEAAADALTPAAAEVLVRAHRVHEVPLVAVSEQGNLLTIALLAASRKSDGPEPSSALADVLGAFVNALVAEGTADLALLRRDAEGQLKRVPNLDTTQRSRLERVLAALK